MRRRRIRQQTVGRIWPRQAQRKPPKNSVSYTFQSANRSKGQVRLDYILTKQADRRLIRCVNVRRPLEAPELDHNSIYAKVRIPLRPVPNRKKRDSTKESPKLADLRWLMTDPNYRCQVSNAMVGAQPPLTMAPASVTSPPTWPTSCFPLRPNWYRAFSAHAKHNVGARGPVWKLS